ncbi:MAG: InlB B-repeat-containing protein, partial [Propionibacteriaceae bacterium]|nr:InlB B-repeat-containing protein [Propionibacteriaceae bacterium]
SAIELGGGKLNMTGGTLIAAPPPTSIADTPAGGGTNTSGYAVAIVSKNGYAGNMTANILDGALQAPDGIAIGAVCITSTGFDCTALSAQFLPKIEVDPTTETVLGQFNASNYGAQAVYAVTFDPGDGTPAPNTQYVFPGGFVGKPTPPTRAGYAFTGWYTDADAKTPFTFESGGASTATVDATWPLSSSPECGAYATSGDDTTPCVQYNVTLYAGWAEAATITYDAAGGTLPAGFTNPEAVKIGDAPTLPPPTKDGYTFNGWFDLKATLWPSAVAVDKTTDTVERKANVTLTAQWSCNCAEVAYKTNGGILPDGFTSPESVQIGAVPTLPTPTRFGYTFGGWFDDSKEPPVEWNSNSEIGSNADLTLDARWAPKAIVMSYDPNSPQATGTVASQTVNYDSNWTVAQNGFTLTGYTFTGWNSKADGSGTTYLVGASIPVNWATDLKVFAQWQVTSVDVTGVTVTPPSATMTVDETLTANATVSPANATDPSVKWSTNNSSVATVNSSGVVQAVGPGTADITVTTNDGGFKATFTVTVRSQVDNVIALIDGLPNPINTMDDVDLVVGATNAYNALTPAQQAEISPSDLAALTAAQAQAGAVNKTDGSVSVAGNLPWNVQLVVVPTELSASESAPFISQIGDKQVLLLVDIDLVDMLTGQAWELPGGTSVTVSIGDLDLADVTGVVVGHLKADDTFELLQATVSGNTITFNTTSFSLYGVLADPAQTGPSNPPTGPSKPGSGGSTAVPTGGSIASPNGWAAIAGFGLIATAGGLALATKRRLATR